MTELNRTAVSEKEWKAFISDIVEVQSKHGITLVPTLKFSPVAGVTTEWGGIRNEKKTQDGGASGDNISEGEGG